MKKYHISIIVPIYKAEAFISRCIESVLLQTHPDWELLLINDGSPDCSGEICQQYAIQDNRIKYFEQKNQGVSAARNLGIEKAKGDIVTFLDADDYAAREMCERIAQYWEDTLELLIFDYKEVYSDGKKIHRHFFQQRQIDFKSDQKYDMDFLRLSLLMYYQDWDETAVHTLAVPWGRAYARSFLESNQIRFPVEIYISEDRIFNLRCAGKLRNVKYVSRPLYCYYMNDQSITNTMYREDIIKLIHNFNHVFKEIRHLTRLNKDKRYLEAYSHFIVVTLIQMLWWKPDEKVLWKREKYDMFCKKYMNYVYALGLKSFSMKEKIFILCYRYRLLFFLKLYVRIKKTIMKEELLV